MAMPKPWTGLIAAIVVVAVTAVGVTLYNVAQNARPDRTPPPDRRCVSTLDDGRTAQVDLEQAGNASLIAGIAASRNLPPRAVSIALATAFQESGIRNLDYGDLDSLGLFQQRPAAGWGTPEEIMDPYYATNRFFDAMVKVENWAEEDIGDVAQAVQRSAFPDAYDQHVERARILASALSGETPRAWTCHVRDTLPADPEGLADALEKTYGPRAAVPPEVVTSPDDPDQPDQVHFAATTEQVAWSAAAFAQSWATTYGVHQVQVGEYSWTGQADVLAGWIGQPTDLDPTTVVITFI